MLSYSGVKIPVFICPCFGGQRVEKVSIKNLNIFNKSLKKFTKKKADDLY